MTTLADNSKGEGDMSNKQRGIYLAEAIILVLCVLVIAMCAYALDVRSNRPTISLTKDKWECVKEEMHIRLQPIVVGRSIQQQPIPETECVEYRRVGN